MIVGAWSCLLFLSRKIKGSPSVHVQTCSNSLANVCLAWKTFELIDSVQFVKPGGGLNPSFRLQLMHVERL